MDKILLVTNDAGVISLWRDTATAQGYALDVAISGEEALSRAQGGNPLAIVIGSVELPQQVILEQLKRSPATASIPTLCVEAEQLGAPEQVIARLKGMMASHRVLVAEDDRQMSMILSMVLEKAGYKVKQTHDGAETLREIKAWHPHLLVLDIMLPVLDGFHVCQTINEDHSFEPRPRVLIISGRGSDWDQNLGAACGADDYMVKPINHVVFLEKVRAIVALK